MVQKAIPENMYEIHPSDFCLQSKSCLLFRGEVVCVCVCVTNTLSLYRVAIAMCSGCFGPYDLKKLRNYLTKRRNEPGKEQPHLNEAMLLPETSGHPLKSSC